MREKKKRNILEAIFEHYWWNIRGFSYRINNDEDQEREIIASALEPFLENSLRKGQSKIKVKVKDIIYTEGVKDGE